MPYRPGLAQAAIIQPLLTVSPQTSMKTAIACLNQANAEAAADPLGPPLGAAACVVVVEHQQVVGLLTASDIVRWATQPQEQQPVAQVMTHPVVTLPAAALSDIWAAVALLRQHRVEQVVLVNEQGGLVGLATHASLMHALAVAAATDHRSGVCPAGQAGGITPQSLARQRDFNRLLVTLTSRFVEVSDQQLDAEISHALEQIGAFIGVDKSHVIAFDEPPTDGAPATMSVTHAWYRPGCPRVNHPQGPIPLAAFPWVTTTILQRGIVQVPWVDALPDDCAIDRASWRRWGIQSMLSVPLIRTGGVVGCLGFVSFSQPTAWDEDTVQLLTVMAQTIANAQDQARLEAERQTVEQALRTREAHYRALISALPDLIVRLNAEGIYQEFVANPTFAVVGDMAELVGTHVTDSLPPKAAQQRLEAIHQALITKTIQLYEQDLSFDDQLQVEEVRVVPYGDNEVLALVRDVSAQRAAHQERQQAARQLQALNQSLERKVDERTAELRAREAQMMALVGAIPDLLLRVATDGRCLEYVQPQHQSGQFSSIHSHLAECLPADLMQRQLEAIERAIATGELQVYEHQLQKQGRLVDEEVRIVGIGPDEALVMVRNISDRKQVEQENQRLRDRLEFLLSTSPAVIHTCQIDGNCRATFMSPNVSTILGYQADDILADPEFWGDRIHPDDRAQVQASMAQVLSQDSHSCEYRFLHRDGHYVWLHDDNRLVRDAQGNPIEVIGYFADITSRKRTEAQLLDSELRFRRMFDSNTVGMMFSNVDGAITEANDCFWAMLGYTQAEIANQTLSWIDLTPPEYSAQDANIVEHLKHHGTMAPVEKAYYHKAGHQVPILLGVAMLSQAEGSCVCIAVDISDRKQVELALQASEAKFRQLAENVPAVVYRYVLHADHQSTFTYFSPYVETIYGLPPEVALGDAATLFDRVYSDDVAALEAAVIASAQSLEPFYSEHRIIAIDGTLKWIQVSATPERLANGDTLWQGVMLDISDRKRAETALRESQQLLQTVLDTFPLAVFWKDCNSVYLGGNQRFADTTGLGSPQAILGKTDFDFSYLETEALAYRAADRQVMNSGQPSLGVEEILTLPTGEQRWLETNRLPLRDLSGQIVATVGTFQDITCRKQAELERQTLLQELAAFKLALDEAAIVAITDIQGVTTYVNDRFVEVSGYTEAEAMGNTHRIVNSGYHSPYFFKDLWTTILSGQVWRGELCNRTKKGQIFWVDSTIVPFLDDQGRPVKFLSVQFDITDRKQAEIALQNSNNLMGIISQAQAQFITATNRLDIFDGLLTRLLDVSKSNYSFIGEVLFDDDGSAVLEDGCLKIKGIPHLQTYCLTQLDGNPTPKAPEASSPQPGVDVTALNTLLTTVIKTGQPVIANRLNSNLKLGGTSDECPSLRSFLGLPFFQGNTLVGVVGLANHPSGYDQDMIDYLDPFLATCSNLIEGYRLDRDRRHTEAQLNRTNAELARATRLKDEFLANMSHELRTPLNAILGMTEALQEEILGAITPRQANALKTVERSGTHLLELINDILDVAKIESGQLELDVGAIAVEDLCQSSLTFVKQQALKKRIRLDVQIPKSLPPLWGDELRLRQVLINLLNNAVKFTPEQGSIIVKITPLPAAAIAHPLRLLNGSLAPHALRFSIRDTGIGIATDDIDKLFQPFVQIDSALNRQYQGTGLGLALVKQIVTLHGGQVGLTSEVGVGSCFTVDLPYERIDAPGWDRPPTAPPSAFSTAAIAPIADSIPDTTGAPVILLAEDQETNISTITSYLTIKGYGLLIARSGEEAIALAQSGHPDLILMDIQMPGMDGLEAIRRLRQDPQLATRPIIALTALAMAKDRDRCLAAGANLYLSKPVRLDQLVTTIQTLLNSPPP
ncbi:PAS domain S-box protein [Nodosilinea sp. E11]|uniref:PAS domain S-box protein n=1 Tax=Nodosilinea sp. E11 TaxID=3037479 RepID=UPI00293434D6|nr:PAS domain S-box protein [Nodosilinea sp. E11]